MSFGLFDLIAEAIVNICACACMCACEICGCTKDKGGATGNSTNKPADYKPGCNTEAAYDNDPEVIAIMEKKAREKAISNSRMAL